MSGERLVVVKFSFISKCLITRQRQGWVNTNIPMWSPNSRHQSGRHILVVTHLGLFFQAKTQREIAVIHYTHPPGASNGSRSWVGSQNASTLLEESMSRDRLGVTGKSLQNWSWEQTEGEKGREGEVGGGGFILLQLNDYIMWQNLYFYTLFCDWGQKFILLSASLPLSILEYCF